jgi:GTP cyclohydrolase II
MLPLRFADGFGTTARVYTFDGLADGPEHLALGPAGGGVCGSRGRAAGPDPQRVLHRRRPWARAVRLRAAAARGVPAHRAGRGLLLYLRQGRGIGLYARLDAYGLQDAGLDTYDANLALGYSEDGRDYTVAAQMLGDLGLDRVALLSNNPDKAAHLDRLGVTVAERVLTAVHLNAINARYLATKAGRGAHTLDLPCDDVLDAEA